MFQRGITILLIACTLTANFSRLFVFAGFQLNQKYIASALCENRDKPWLHCNGRCYLMKKIKAAEEKEKNEDRQTQKNLVQQVFFTTVKKVTFSSQLLQVFPDRYQQMALQNVSLNILRPHNSLHKFRQEPILLRHAELVSASQSQPDLSKHFIFRAYGCSLLFKTILFITVYKSGY